MFEPIPELDSDLEWMLQSQQANSDMLLEELLEEHWNGVLRLALVVLGEPDAAYVATADTFSMALVQAHAYRPADGAAIWVYRLALEGLGVLGGVRLYRSAGMKAAAGNSLWSAVQALDRRSRALLALHTLHAWPDDQLARLFRTSPQQIEAQRSLLRRRLQVQDNQLHEALAGRWPELDPYPGGRDELKAYILDRATRSGARKLRLARLQEAGWVMLAALLVGGLLWGANRFFPDPEAGRLATRMPTLTPFPGSEAFLSPSVTPEGDAPSVAEADRRSRRRREGVVYLVQPGDTLASIAAEAGVSSEEILRYNNLATGETLEPGLRLFIPSTFRMRPRLTPTPVMPAPQPVALNLQSTSSEILDRMLQSGQFWHTLWADTVMLDYGPSSYIGPPQGYRLQSWINPPRQMFSLAGPLDGYPRTAYLMDGLRGYVLNLEPGHEGEYSPSTVFAGLELRNLMFFSRSPLLNQPGTFLPVMLESVAGREALAADWVGSDGVRAARLWVDVYTGVILRQWEYAGANKPAANKPAANLSETDRVVLNPEDGSVIDRQEEIILSDFLVTSIEYDVNFPNRLFEDDEPWEGGFAIDSSGLQLDFFNSPWMAGDFPERPPGRTPVVAAPPPPGFNPAQAELLFQYDPEPHAALTTLQEPYSLTLTAPVALAHAHLFADGYDLGTVELGSPWSVICDRSPDGLQIAFTNQKTGLRTGQQPGGAGIALAWFSLLNPQDVHTTNFPDGKTPVFAFGPDSQHIAFLWQRETDSGIYVLDTQPGLGGTPAQSGGTAMIEMIDRSGIQLLLNLVDAKSLVWKPDGSELALIARLQVGERLDERVMVLRVADGAVLYSQSIDDNGGSSAEWPMLAWGVDFPVEMGGLEACTLP